MSFQDFDFKSDRACPVRPGNTVSAKSSGHLNLMAKLLVITTIVMLLGFSVSNWQPTAEAADSTSKSDRLHVSLTLPERRPSTEQVPEAEPEEIEAEPWESVIIKSGDTLASIFASKGISSTTTHKIARLNEQTKKLRYIKPGQEIQLLLDEARNLRQMKYISDITRTLLIKREDDQSFFGRPQLLDEANHLGTGGSPLDRPPPSLPLAPTVFFGLGPKGSALLKPLHLMS